MVNIPLLKMDDFGLLEPTDVGNMTVNYDPKDEKSTKFRWDQDEVLCLLSLVRDNNFITRFSITKMAGLLSQLMFEKGFYRSEKQIHVKLTAMRRNYLMFEKQKQIGGSWKECPFYKELREIYREATNGIDSEDYDSQDDCLIKIPGDPVDWTKGEVQKMLTLIKTLRLKNEVTLTYISPIAVKMIAEGMINSGFDRSSEQVKNALINLRTTYIDYKISFDNNEDPEESLFYPSLETLWGKEYKKCRLKEKEKRKANKTDDWSLEETIVLLTLIQDLNIADEAYKNTENSAEKLKLSLAENGYNRTMQQIRDRLNHLKSDFLSAHQNCTESEAIRQFAYYNLYKKLFERQFSYDTKSFISNSFHKNLMDFCADLTENPKPTFNGESRATIWAAEEIKLLLRKVHELISGPNSSDFLEEEKLKKLSSMLNDVGYHKTIEEIKKKLTELKISYMKCNLEGSSEKDIFECPFYNELHDIFHTPVSDERYELIQNLLSENLDPTTSKFFDHCYTTTNFTNSSSTNTSNEKVTVIPNDKCLESWFPVESIIDDVNISPSTTFDLHNLSSITTKEQEQVVEDALLEALPNNTVSDNVVVEKALPSIAKSNIFDKDVIPAHEEPKFSQIYRYLQDPNITRIGDSPKRNATSPSIADEQPISKKPRIIEDEKSTGNKKFLLKPLGAHTNPSMNITNTKFVRLIVANDSNKNKVNHITAHIEPMNTVRSNSLKSNSVSSRTSSPVERGDLLKIATDKIFTKEDFNLRTPDSEREVGSTKSQCNGNTSSFSNLEFKIKESIQEAVHTIVKHDEVLQQRHHEWMEKQFELQREHEESRQKLLRDELKELRTLVTVLLADKQLYLNNKLR